MISELETKFARLARAGQPPVIVLDPFLQEVVRGDPSRRDRALAFYQLLVLTSLEIVRAQQPIELGDINITKGSKYAVRWRSQQRRQLQRGKSNNLMQASAAGIWQLHGSRALSN